MRSILFICSLFLSLGAFATSFPAPMKPLAFNQGVVHEDFLKIIDVAGFPQNSIDFKFVDDGSLSKFMCNNGQMTLYISSKENERTSAFYKGLREIGFLFPHPLRQISPKLETVKTLCGRTWEWKPTIKYRGFHLHTLHPNEWIAGFFQNKADVADATIRWMARNQQNIFDLALIQMPLEIISAEMGPHFRLAQALQIYTGVSLGIALNQQNSYKLLSLWDSYFGWSSDEKITEGLKNLFAALPLNYIILEGGSSEFTPTDYEKTIRWLNLAGQISEANNIVLMTKVHVSSNQVSTRWGNYNFLPQFNKSTVGILPHTVMFYGLNDEKAPMYGNKTFHGIRDFMLKEKSKRRTWYYPETSYWVGMDVDVPLFLTDYLRTRTEDFKYLVENDVEGHLNFTSGHVLGYWLFDWNLTLLTDSDYNFDPMIGLKLLGEDLDAWKKIMDYQALWYKQAGVIRMLSSANLQDELSQKHRIHDRNTMKDLSKKPEEVGKEIILLREAYAELPELDAIKDNELKTMLQINVLRHNHALAIREKNFDSAKANREKAKALIKDLSQLPTNYPELKLFDKWENPTAYQFGYVYPAASLYFWEREERQLKNDSFWPFTGNMYDVIDIVL